MEYNISKLVAEASTGKILVSHWTIDHRDGEFSAHRFGATAVPPDNEIPISYSLITKEEAILATKALMGEATCAMLEEAMLEEIENKKNPNQIEGVPWPPDAPGDGLEDPEVE